MVHRILVKASYQIILNVLIAPLMNTAKSIKICYFCVTLMSPSATTNRKCMEKLCNLNGLTSLTQKPTCFKNPDKPTCIDLFLTNQPNCFQHSNVFKTGFSDFHLLTVTEFRMSFKKLQLKIINHHDYKNFGNE